MTTSAPGIRRRALLGTGLLGLLTACGSGTAGSADGRTARTVLGPDPDLPVRARARAATAALAGAYDAALLAHPDLGGRLRPLRAQLAVQLTAFGAATATPTPSATAVPSATAPPVPPAAPSSAAAMLLGLGTAELGTAAARTADLAAASPALARQLASAAANGAQHAMLLRGSVPAGPAPAGPPAGAPLPAPALAALQAALAAEDAAVYAYGVVGAELGGARRTAATAAYQAHRARRGALQQWIAATGAVPVAAAPAYQLPAAVTGTASAVRLAGLVEDRTCAVYANAVQATAGALRGGMAAALRQAALDTLAWRGAGSAFPGIADG
ncbi:DUF4439 domain-containing protein [Streptacidiphilus cavernicola]|uniref:DUF4439 domain-containing protein n=1 Tax=Streptacidiphilus cavernicola TaxID=3342716 RepID=A0ABV6W658_9ACTN